MKRNLHVVTLILAGGLLSLTGSSCHAAAGADSERCQPPSCDPTKLNKPTISPKAAEPVRPGASDKMPRAVGPGTKDAMPSPKAPGTTDDPIIRPDESKAEKAK